MLDRVDTSKLLLGVIRMSLALAVVFGFVTRDFVTLAISLLTLLSSYVPELVERRYNIVFPSVVSLGVVFFVYATLFLGEVVDFYERFWWWDFFMHALSGFGFALMGFVALLMTFQASKSAVGAGMIAVFSVALALALGALWEIFEFTMDANFGLNMQRSGLRDTMWDLIADALSAIATGVAGYWYLKRSQGRRISAIRKRLLQHAR